MTAKQPAARSALRDHLLFALVGALVGFVAAYFLFEAVGSKQPARVSADAAVAATQGGEAAAAPGDAAAQQAEMQRQATQVEQFLQENPGVPEAWLQLANLRFDTQRYPAAVEAYGKYLELAPANPDVLTDLGVSYHLMGQPQAALEQFAAARALAPDHWQARFNEVVVLAFDLGRFDEASEVLDDLRRMQPDNPDVERLATEVERRRNAG